MDGKRTSTGNVLNIVPKIRERLEEQGELSFTVREALEEAMRELDNEESILHQANKILIIGLDDRNDQYITGFIQGGMRMSECLSLMEVIKLRCLELMGW